MDSRREETLEIEDCGVSAAEEESKEATDVADDGSE